MRTSDSSTQSNPAAGRIVLWGLASRRLRWGLTWRGRLLLAVVLVTVLTVAVRKVHAFLAINRPVTCEYLVVEGWIPEYALAEAGEFFRQVPARRILTVGGPTRNVSEPAAEDDTYASVAASKLRKLGYASVTEMIPTNARDRDRTLSSALAVKRWLADRQIPCGALTVVTLGTHARRTRLLFERTFGSGAQIGVLSVRHREYDPDHWWRYSEGVKEVASEGLAYLYTRLQF